MMNPLNNDDALGDTDYNNDAHVNPDCDGNRNTDYNS